MWRSTNRGRVHTARVSFGVSTLQVVFRPGRGALNSSLTAGGFGARAAACMSPWPPNPPGLLAIPLPDADAHAYFKVRASGPALAMGTVAYAKDAISMPAYFDVLQSEGIPLHSRMVATLNLSVPGVYTVEALRLYDNLTDVRSPAMQQKCVSDTVERPVLIARVLLGFRLGRTPGDRNTRLPGWAHAPTPQWIAAPWLGTEREPRPSCTPLSTRIQSCGYLQLGKDQRNMTVLGTKSLFDAPPPLAGLNGDEHAHTHGYVWATLANGIVVPAPPAPLVRAQGVCIVGGSHAGQLTHEVLGARWLLNRWPRDTLEPLDPGCRLFVLIWGQWDLSRYSGGAPWPFEAVEFDLTERLRELSEARAKNVSTLLMSTNYNPLNCIITQCPPADWRSPPMVEEYNRILHRLSVRFGVTMLDNTDILGPLWDASHDFSHPSPTVVAVIIARLVNHICANGLVACVPVDKATHRAGGITRHDKRIYDHQSERNYQDVYSPPPPSPSPPQPPSPPPGADERSRPRGAAAEGAESVDRGGNGGRGWAKVSIQD